MADLSFVIIALAVWLPIILLVMWLSGWRTGKKLTRMLEQLYQGDLAAVEAFDFLNVQPEKLYYPFTEWEMRRIAHCGIGRKHDLTVRLMHPLQAMVGNYYYHVAWDFEGTDDQGRPFTLQREGYLFIECSYYRGHFAPCITSVQTRRRPFT